MKTNLNGKLALLTAAGALLFTGAAYADHDKSTIQSSSSDSEAKMSFEYGHDGLEMREPAGAAVSSQSYSLSNDPDKVADKILRMYQKGRQHAFWLDKQLAEKGATAVVEETYHHDTGTVRFGDRDSEELVDEQIEAAGSDVDVDVEAGADIDEPAGADLDAKSNLDIRDGGVSTSLSTDSDLDANIESNISDHETDVNIDADSSSNFNVDETSSSVTIDEPAGAQAEATIDTDHNSLDVDANADVDLDKSDSSLSVDQNSTSFSGDSTSDLNQSTTTLGNDSEVRSDVNINLDDPAGASSDSPRLDSSLDSPNPSVAPCNDGGVTERSTASEINASAAQSDYNSDVSDADSTAGSEINEPSGADNSINRDLNSDLDSDSQNDNSSGLLEDRASDFQSNNSADGSISEPSGAESESSSGLSTSSEEEERKYHP